MRLIDALRGDHFSAQSAKDKLDTVILTTEKKFAIFRDSDDIDAISISAFGEANRLAEAQCELFQTKQE
jgi:hypothetical protein